MQIPELVDLQRPRWRPHVPALWRDATTMQLGEDVVVDRMSPECASWLCSVDGSTSSDELARNLTLSPVEARRLLRALRAAGALVDAARVPASLRYGTLADRDAAARRWDAILDTHRDLDRALDVAGRRDRLRVAVTGTGELRDTVAATLEAAGLTEVATAAKATCVILTDSHHPDVPAYLDAGDLDLPHLHVGARGDRAIIGPLVAPGATSCLRCAHLHRRDADAAWPLLAVQWAQADRHGENADPLILRLAAAQAVHLLRVWTDGPESTLRWANMAIDIRLADLVGRVVPRPPHPLCGCLWAAQSA